ncbi:MAG: hypothetical protein J6L96_06960 [Clostridia bacterium]|nr:hypothetical protein [Clostridia bacterium]
MKIEIKHRYLVFPVSTFSPQIKFRFFNEGDMVYSLNVKLNPTEPIFTAYVDMERYMGKTIEIKTEPEVKIVYSEADTMDIPNLYKESFRPQVHFTTKTDGLTIPTVLCTITANTTCSTSTTHVRASGTICTGITR